MLREESNDLIIKYGTHKTLLIVLEWNREAELSEWVRQKVAKLMVEPPDSATPEERESFFENRTVIAELLVNSHTFLPLSYHLIMHVLGDRIYEVCDRACFEIIRDQGHPEPEKYIFNRIRLHRFSQDEHLQPRAVAALQKHSRGLDQQQLQEYAAPYGLHCFWYQKRFMAWEKQRELASKYGVDLDRISSEEVPVNEMTLEERFVYKLSTGGLNLGYDVTNRFADDHLLIDALEEKIRRIEPNASYPFRAD